MKTVSNEVDKKLEDANKYADEKRGELVQNVNDAATKAQESATSTATNLLGKINLGK